MPTSKVDYNGGDKKPDGNGSMIRRAVDAAGSAFSPDGWLLRFAQLPAMVIITGMFVYTILILGPQFYNDQIEQSAINRETFREEIQITRKMFQDEIQATRNQQEVIRKWDEQREDARRKWDELRWQATNDLIRENHRATTEARQASEARWESARQILDRLMAQQSVQQKAAKFQADSLRILIKQVDTLILELRKRRIINDPPRETPQEAGAGILGSAGKLAGELCKP